MATKPTSMAAMVAKQAADESRKNDTEDKELARQKIPFGKSRVRLVRPHYDAEGFYHPIGIALLNADAVPASAKIISTNVEVDDAEKDE